jgi:hypothetical protein
VVFLIKLHKFLYLFIYSNFFPYNILGLKFFYTLSFKNVQFISISLC